MPLPPKANSCRLVFPTITAPACFSCVTIAASSVATRFGELPAGGRRAHSRHIDQVFQRDGNSMQRAAPVARRDFCVCSSCLLQRQVRRHRDERVERGIQPLDAIETLARQLNGRQLAAANLFGSFNQGEHCDGHYATGRLLFVWHFSQTP